MDTLSSKCPILFQRAYADWSRPNMESWRQELNLSPITAIQQFHHDEKQALLSWMLFRWQFNIKKLIFL